MRKRNEFEYEGRTLVDLGGTEFIEQPDEYPANARALIEDLGIDPDQSDIVFDHDLYPSFKLRGGVFFDQETFGEDRLVAGREGLVPGDLQTAYVTLPAELENGEGNKELLSEFLNDTPLSTNARDEIVELFCGDTDFMAEYSVEQKMVRLGSISYVDFLKDSVGASQETIDFLRMWRASYMGNGVDLTPALNALCATGCLAPGDWES